MYKQMYGQCYTRPLKQALASQVHNRERDIHVQEHAGQQIYMGIHFVHVYVYTCIYHPRIINTVYSGTGTVHTCTCIYIYIHVHCTCTVYTVPGGLCLIASHPDILDLSTRLKEGEHLLSCQLNTCRKTSSVNVKTGKEWEEESKRKREGGKEGGREGGREEGGREGGREREGGRGREGEGGREREREGERVGGREREGEGEGEREQHKQRGKEVITLGL